MSIQFLVCVGEATSQLVVGKVRKNSE
jgi:hypothetical protein